MSDKIDQQFGNYQTTHLLGKGGFANVYLAKHCYLGTLAAIKVLNIQAELSTRDLILKEARVSARLDHPHINQVIEFGFQGTTPYLVMGYAPGGSLRAQHPRRSSFSLERIVYYVLQIADALQYAHDRNVIHRDVKPENVLLNGRNEVLLSDFGIAVVASETQTLSEQEKAGTSLYMAPEQARGKARAASDQYSLAVVVYEWLTGVPPFQGTSAIEIALKHQMEAPPPLTNENVRWIDAGMVPAIAPVVMKALEKDPKQRYASVSAFARALDDSCREWKNLRLGTMVTLYRPHASYTDTLAWAPHGRTLVSGSEDATVQIWDPWTCRRHITYLGHNRCVHDVSWSPDGKKIASASDDKTVQIWEASTGNPILTYRNHSDHVEAVSWSPDGNALASSSTEKLIHVWQADTGKRLAIYRGHDDGGIDGMGLPALAWSPNGKSLASGGDDRIIHIWQAATGQIQLHYQGHKSMAERENIVGSTINALQWSPDGAVVASASWDHTVHVWQASTGKQLLIYRGHTSGVECIAWSPDGKYLASGGMDNTVQIWNTMTGKCYYTCRLHDSSVHAVVWSPDGLHLASSDGNGFVALWKAR